MSLRSLKSRAETVFQQANAWSVATPTVESLRIIVSREHVGDQGMT